MALEGEVLYRILREIFGIRPGIELLASPRTKSLKDLSSTARRGFG